MEEVLTSLELAYHDHETPESVVAMGTWNLLRHYIDEQEPLPGLAELVRDVLGFELEEALRLRRERRDVFPPFRGLSIVGSRWRLTEDIRRTTDVCFEMTVRRPLSKLPKSPADWLQRSGFFWRALKVGRRKERHFLTAEIYLPGRDGGQPEPLTLEITQTATKLERVITFTMPKREARKKEKNSGRILAYAGTLTMSKKKSRPDRTLVRHERHVRFGNGAMQGFEEETLAYWIQADTLCLALH